MKKAKRHSADNNRKSPEDIRIELADIWRTLVKCLVLQHKGQGITVFKFGDRTQEELHLLTTIVQDEVNESSIVAQSRDDSIYKYAARLQVQEKFSKWVASTLLDKHDAKTEQLRLDGVLFRQLEKALPAELKWIPNMVRVEQGNKQGQ